ncbi:MAG TPA: alpha-hydroxy acid oxidase, partial [Solirubrobacterales bacterium]|nr:alpha-hydroxy acid oxidase [Solirubrobacterales bacterium]
MNEDWINVGDAERAGEEKLEQGPRDYFAGGAGDEITLGDNVAAWGRWRLRPRVLTDVSEVTTEAEVFGRPVAAPVLVAPIAYQRMAHPEAEAGMAAGAAEAGTAICLSTLSTTRPAEVAAAAPGGRHWFQLYAFKDAGVTRALMDEAIAAGFEAIVVTADAPPGGNRERDRRNRFTLPRELGTPSLTAATGGEEALTIEDTFALMNHSLTWADVEGLASECDIPVLVKGLLSAEDAELALAHGAAGVVVSN